ncbi:MAG: alpha/beta hydrolase [Planctomycetes bacterium]|nr:alpha/beta hydrolase [Planctomycetota bacterium]
MFHRIHRLDVVSPAFWIALLTSTTHAAAQQDPGAALLELAHSNPRLTLRLETRATARASFLEGTYRVFENRRSRQGRTLDLHLVILPALGEAPLPDPIFILHGGPGAAATALAASHRDHWARTRRDLVFVDQRGTGGSNPLHVPALRQAHDTQDLFSMWFRPELFRAALPELARHADLTQYTTEIGVDDFDEVRAALGYERINLRGGSYGSRAALVYMRRHPSTIRTATLQGIAPIAFRNPLPHPRSAQEGLDLIFEECASTAAARRAFPDLRAKFAAVLERLETQPATVHLETSREGTPDTLRLSRDAFAEAIRVLMYTTDTNREIPRLILAAYQGDFAPLVERALPRLRVLRGAIAFGMLMCVVGSEDIPRIDPAEIDAACADSFMRKDRLLGQMEIARFWPRGELDDTYNEPVAVDVPTLLLSGSHDPVTTPAWGAEAARHLPHSLHVVVPGGHGVGGPAVAALERAFLTTGTVEGLDLRAIATLRMPPLRAPFATKPTRRL